MPRDRTTARDGPEYVGAGVLYLALAAGFFLLWLQVDWYVVLFLSAPTCVAGLVLLSVGWPRWRRELAQRHAAEHRQAVAQPPVRVRRS